MYSRRQRSSRNAAATTSANTQSNGRTTRGRTSKAKHPRRGGGNPDTARLRASIERAPVVPWVKVMRPPSLHLRRTFLVEKWVRPSDLSAREREVYDENQKEKEKEHQRFLNWQQQKREQDEKEKERDEQPEQERKENDLSLMAEVTAEYEVQDSKETVSEEKQEISVVKPIFDTSATTASTSTKSNLTTTTASKTEKLEVSEDTEMIESEQMPDSPRVLEGEDYSAVKPMFETAAAIASTSTTSKASTATVSEADKLEITQTVQKIASEQVQNSSRLRHGEGHSAVKPISQTAAAVEPPSTPCLTDKLHTAQTAPAIVSTKLHHSSRVADGEDHSTPALISKSHSTSQQMQASLIDTMKQKSSKPFAHDTAISDSSQHLQQAHKDTLLQANANMLPRENMLVEQEQKETLLQKNGSSSNDPPQENFSANAKEEEQRGKPDTEDLSPSAEPSAKKLRID